MSIKEIAKRILEVYRKTDNDLRLIPKVCRQGCAACCHQYVPMLATEEFPIAEYISKRMPKKIRHRVRQNAIDWLDYFDRHTPSGLVSETDFNRFEKQLAKDRIPCPFLIEGSCSIYEVRPLICRLHIQESEPELCERDVLRDSSLKGEKIAKERFAELVQAFEYVQFRPMVYALKDALKIKRQCKGIVAQFSYRLFNLRKDSEQ